MIKRLNEGYRLPPPPVCPRFIYAIMVDCWHINHHSRPDFECIIQCLAERGSALLVNTADESLAGNLDDHLEAGQTAFSDSQKVYSY